MPTPAPVSVAREPRPDGASAALAAQAVADGLGVVGDHLRRAFFAQDLDALRRGQRRRR